MAAPNLHPIPSATPLGLWLALITESCVAWGPLPPLHHPTTTGGVPTSAGFMLTAMVGRRSSPREPPTLAGSTLPLDTVVTEPPRPLFPFFSPVVVDRERRKEIRQDKGLCYVHQEVIYELLLHRSSFAQIEIGIAFPIARQSCSSSSTSASISPASSSPSTMRHERCPRGHPSALPSLPLHPHVDLHQLFIASTYHDGSTDLAHHYLASRTLGLINRRA